MLKDCGLVVGQFEFWYSVLMQPCAERDKLREIAGEALDDIINFTERLRKAVRSEGPWGSLSPLDQDLENAVGSKERAFGALAQHCKEHGCDR